MIRFDQDIDSLSNFKRRTSQFLKRMKKTGQPVVLTVNGKAQMVVQDAKAYQEILDLVEQLKVLDAIREGMAETKAAKGRPVLEVLAQVRKKFGLS